jgi:hypothetical protein
MFVFPLLSVTIEAAVASSTLGVALVGKWFVFWSVGVRLFTAGLSQVLEPEYTANVILGLKSGESFLLVRELGFANLAIGLLGILSLPFPTWRLPGALAGCVFYGLAGVNHALQSHRNQLENVAMVSDLGIALILFGVCAITGWQALSTQTPRAAS